MANGAGNGNDGVETLVSSIRPGMKREFSLLLKEQGGGLLIEMGQRRTRNGASRNSEGSNGNPNNKRLKVPKAKKMKKEVPNQVVDGEEREVEEAAGVEMLKDNAARNSREKVGLISEEEEPKSDVVDGNSDDEMKGNLIQEGIAEGQDMGKVKLEELGKASEMETDCGKLVDEYCTQEPRDGVLEGTNQDRNVQTVSGFQVGNLMEISGLGDKAGVTVAALDVVGNSEKPLRRFTRSLLKPRGEASEISDVEFAKGEEAAETHAASPAPSSSKMEMKMSKKVELTKSPTRLKDLLDTGLLEGLSVQYIRGTRARAPGDAGLQGVIQGSGILCFCKMCNGTKVVTPNQFELHAASANKRPPEYIYLKNGRTLRDVLNACKGASADTLELTIRQAAGCMDAEASKHLVDTKGSAASVESVQCLNCQGNELSAKHLEDTPRSSPKSTSTISSSDSGSKAPGKLTKKDLKLHKKIFSSKYLPDGTELGYFTDGQRALGGHKSGHGIYCECCHKVVSPSTFEAHAGFSSRRKPYEHIYTSEGMSLHELSIKIKKEEDVSTDENDDICSICRNRGKLLCCDNCPRAFHQECVDLQFIPRGKWYCRSCELKIRKEENAKPNANAIAAGRVAGIDPFEEIKKRCIRILDTIEQDDGGCVLCRGHEFSESEFGPLTVMICDQCEKEYHVGCLKQHEMDDLKELPDGKWFCRSECRNIHSALQNLVADGERRIPDLVLDLIRKKHEETGSQDDFDSNITWRLLHGQTASEQDRKWLSDAVSVFHDRFDPIAVNAKQDDLIPFMIKGHNNGDQDFGGIYCAILVVNSVVVSAGMFRVFGQEVAEMPLVATSNSCQGKGYFQSLFCCIEDLLASLNVRNVVLPAAPEAKSIWMNKFGFEKITEEQLKEYQKDYQFMVFQGITVLQKPVHKPKP